MLRPGRDDYSGTSLVLATIERSGLMGITRKQIASLTGLGESRVGVMLDQLSTTGSIAQVGRSLWISRTHADLSTPDSERGSSAWFRKEFEKEYALRIGTYGVDVQFRSNDRLPVHRWWPYVQGFSAGFATEALQRYGIGKGSVVLDPFCGSGTVPVVARTFGAQGIGIDLLPVAAFVSNAKGRWETRPERLRAAAERVVGDRRPSDLPRPFLRKTGNQFSPGILESLLRIKENIWAEPAGPVRDLLKLAFAGILIESSHLKRSPCLGYAKKGTIPPELPYRLLPEAVERMCADLRTLQSQRARWGPPLRIVQGNSGQVPLEEESVDLVVTSPPYVNGMDYPTNYKVEMAWLDMIDSYSSLRDLRSSMVACDNIPKSVVADGGHDPRVDSDEWIGLVRTGIRRNIQRKAAYRRLDMADIVGKYFRDLVAVLENVYRSLKPGAPFLVVNGDSLMAGTYVPGDAIFVRLAAKVGFEVEALDIARTRRSGQRRSFLLRESVAVLRKPRNAHPTG